MPKQGHWRNLKPNQVGEGRFGEATSGKTWVDRVETKKTEEAKELGSVPPAQPVGRKGEFIAFAVPGGDFLFVVHQSKAKEFAQMSSGKDWLNSKELKNFMKVSESKGLFGIFKTDKQVVGY